MTTFIEICSIFALSLSLWSGYRASQLSRHIGYEEASRRWKKKIRGKRFAPKALPEKFDVVLADDDLANIREFAGAADWLNEIYSDNCWGFQDTGVLKLYDLSGGSYREIDIYYNQQKMGFIKIICANIPGYEGEVQISVDIMNARQFDGKLIYDLAKSISQIVHPRPENIQPLDSMIASKMLQLTWQVGEEANSNPNLALTFVGKGSWFRSFQRKRAEIL
jgi:hypothetical protein